MMVHQFSYLACLLVVWLVAMRLRSPRARQVALLAASWLFYASWGLGFLALLIASSLMNHALGALLRSRASLGRLWLGIGCNVLLLVVFKYLPAAAGDADEGGLGGLLRDIVMPVGMSFWTFQALSYLFDLYREEELDPSLVELSLYLAFWPTVLSGPVARLPELLPQLRQVPEISRDDISIGVKRIVIGLFMKLFMAGLLARGVMHGEGVDTGFDQYAAGWGGLDVWLLAIGFGFQLYFDFAGYSHIVIGSARLFGIALPENFDRPYFSTTPSIFWTRWHISLSFWIRDYLFMPLATMVRTSWWPSAALFLAMTLFGVWHAATWPFVLWGMYQGLLLVGHRFAQRLRRRLWPERQNTPGRFESFLSWGLTFALICLGWIFFRAKSLDQALAMWQTVLTPSSYTQLGLRPNFYLATTMILAAYFCYSGLEALLSRWQESARLQRARFLLSPFGYAAAIILTIVWSRQESVFVYFAY